jgi:hypothetical protein
VDHHRGAGDDEQADGGWGGVRCLTLRPQCPSLRAAKLGARWLLGTTISCSKAKMQYRNTLIIRAGGDKTYV